MNAPQRSRTVATEQNPPAFPVAFDTAQTGMTLRDWFAGQALAANYNFGVNLTAAEQVRHCYTMADAALAYRVVQA